MIKMLGLINIVLIIMVLVLGVISRKYVKVLNEGIKNNNFDYKKCNLYMSISSILTIISIILSATIYF